MANPKCPPYCAPCVPQPSVQVVLFNHINNPNWTPPQPEWPCGSDCDNYDSTVYPLTYDGRFSNETALCYDVWTGPGECGHTIELLNYVHVVTGPQRQLRIWQGEIGTSIVVATWGDNDYALDCLTLKQLYWQGNDIDPNDCWLLNTWGPGNNAEAWIAGS